MKNFVYVFDAFCPWCYAFTPVVKRLYERYSDGFGNEVLCGGMVVDEIKTIGGAMSVDTARMEYQRITEMTGVQFGEEFFQRLSGEETQMNSETPARAVALFRESAAPDSLIEFIHHLLKALFYEGGNPNEHRFYRELAAQFGMDPETFAARMNEADIKERARYDFALTKQLQVDGFPRLYLQTSDTYFHLISRGFSPFDRVARIVDEIVA